MSHQIVTRGKEEEEIRVVSAIPGSNGKNGFQLHFPCLSVHVTGPKDNYETEHYCITWSNYHERNVKVDGEIVKNYRELPHEKGGPQRGENPGTFKVKRIQMQPDMIQVLDGNRKMVVKRAAFPGGIPHLDYCEMALRWNTHYDIDEGWDYGKDHPMDRTEEEIADCATVDSIERALTERFGEFGIQILELFVTHPLFLEFNELREGIVPENMKIAA